jgi:hypothetical protein
MALAYLASHVQAERDMKYPSLLALALLAVACNDTTGPTSETTTTLVAGMNPTQSGVIGLSPTTYPYILPGGVLLPPGSGLVKVDVSIALARPEPYARLDVYLLTRGGTDSCGRNDPDAPAWTALPAGWTERRTITGFRVFTLPCEVTGIRAILHRRHDDHVFGPPTLAETIVETTVPAQLLIRQD